MTARQRLGPAGFGGAAAAAAGALVMLAIGCGQGADHTTPTRAVVLVSGLDDHGLPATGTVPVHRRPGGAASATLPASTLVHAVAVRGEWTNVTPLHTGPEGAAHEHPSGWVGDYHLRGVLALRADSGCQVTLADAVAGAGVAEALVGTPVEVRDFAYTPDGQDLWLHIAAPGGPAIGWVEADAVGEREGSAAAGGHRHGPGAVPAPPSQATPAPRCG